MGHIFIAKNLTIGKTPQREDSEADMEMKKFKIAQVYEMIDNNEITDTATIIPFFSLAKLLKKIINLLRDHNLMLCVRR